MAGLVLRPPSCVLRPSSCVLRSTPLRLSGSTHGATLTNFEGTFVCARVYSRVLVCVPRHVDSTKLHCDRHPRVIVWCTGADNFNSRILVVSLIDFLCNQSVTYVTVCGWRVCAHKRCEHMSGWGSAGCPLQHVQHMQHT